MTAQDDHPDGVVGLSPQERLVQLDEQAAVLRVTCVGPVEHDAGDTAFIELFVGEELVILGHSGILCRRECRYPSRARNSRLRTLP